MADERDLIADRLNTLPGYAISRPLAAHGLIDGHRLWIYPVLLGSGQRLFEDTTAALRLVHSETTGSGAIVATYLPAGGPRHGGMA